MREVFKEINYIISKDLPISELIANLSKIICEFFDADFVKIECQKTQFEHGKSSGNGTVKSEIKSEGIFAGKANSVIYLESAIENKWISKDLENLDIIVQQIAVAVERYDAMDRILDANHKLFQKTKDLRALLKEEKQIRQMQGEFVAMVSHEFRTPLQIIDGARENIYRKTRNSEYAEQLEKFLNRIKSATGRMNGLIDSVINLSKIESQKNITPNFNEFSISQLLDEIEDKNSENSKNIVISKHYKNDLKFYGDRRMLDHVFSNIIENAIKYSPENTEVKIIAQEEVSSLIIAISDKGIGIPQTDLAKITQKFFRASNTLEISGTGIGLYLSKYFVALHNGDIKIESEVGKGTVVYVILPVDPKDNSVNYGI